FYNTETKIKEEYNNAFSELESFLSTLYVENKSNQEKYHFNNGRAEFFIFKGMKDKAQNIITNMIASDRIKFIESIIKEIIPSADIKMSTDDSAKFIRQKKQESHNQFDIDYKMNYGDLASLFKDVEKQQIEALKIQLENIKNFKAYYDSELNKFASDFRNFSGAFAINWEDLQKNYQEINTSIKDYDDLLREIKELTISRNKSLEDKRTLFDNKRDNWNSIEVQDEVNALNVKIVDCDDKIRSKLTIVRNNRLENQYKDDKNISDAMRNILDWFERYPDIVKNITKA
ncbi:type III effector, partial [Escherichia coli]|nr:type III effector [Escherichia coli]